MKVQHTFTEERLGPVEMDNSVFTLHDTEAKNTNTDKMDAEPSHTVLVFVSMQYEHFHTILYQPSFIGLCTRLGIGQCEYTIKACSH